MVVGSASVIVGFVSLVVFGFGWAVVVTSSVVVGRVCPRGAPTPWFGRVAVSAGSTPVT